MTLDENQDSLNPSEIQRLQELLPAYQLGIADPEEREWVAQTLPKYPHLLAEAHTYEAIHEALLTAVPQVQPPPHLLNDLLQQARSAPQPAQVPITMTRPKLAQVAFSARERILLLGAVATFVLLFGFNLYALLVIADLQEENRALTQNMQAQTQILSRFAKDDMARFELINMHAEDDMRGWVMCNPYERVGVVRVENFPYETQAYKIWLGKDGQRMEAGVLYIEPDGTGVVILRTPNVFGEYEYIRITPMDAANDNSDGNPPLMHAQLY